MPFVAQPYHKNISSFILIIMVMLKLPFRILHFGISIHSYCGDKQYNTNFFLITCFKERNTMVVEKNLQVTINFYKKHVIQLLHGITSNNKHDWTPIKYLNILHHNRTQKQFQYFFLNILHKYYQLPVLRTVDMFCHFYQK